MIFQILFKNNFFQLFPLFTLLYSLIFIYSLLIWSNYLMDHLILSRPYIFYLMPKTTHCFPLFITLANIPHFFLIKLTNHSYLTYDIFTLLKSPLFFKWPFYIYIFGRAFPFFSFMDFIQFLTLMAELHYFYYSSLFYKAETHHLG